MTTCAISGPLPHPAGSAGRALVTGKPARARARRPGPRRCAGCRSRGEVGRTVGGAHQGEVLLVGCRRDLAPEVMAGRRHPGEFLDLPDTRLAPPEARMGCSSPTRPTY